MLVILHGWSDTHRSFQRLGRRLVEAGVATRVSHVRLGDYVSLDDDVTFDDLAHALERAWHKEKLPTTPRSVDVVVHSTGALVIRHWMTTFYQPASNPLRRVLMLAPANFGSPLAHKGRSFIGRIVKGFKSDRLFQTGTHILEGLELASPFSWELALRDRFTHDTWYGPGRILGTVLVGNSGYSGISAAANSDGTDGTVRVSTADLNPTFARFDFSGGAGAPPSLVPRPPDGLTAFTRLPAENHSTIALKDGGPKDPTTFERIVGALQVDDATFPEWVNTLAAQSEAARRAGEASVFTHGFQNTVIRLRDHQGALINDWFLEVFAKRPDGRVDDPLTRTVQERVMAKAHTNEANPAYRSLLFDCTALRDEILARKRSLYISVTAMPDIRKTKTVGYSTFGYDDIGSIALRPELLRELFRPDRTLLVEIVIRREQTDRVFRLLPLEG